MKSKAGPETVRGVFPCRRVDPWPPLPVVEWTAVRVNVAPEDTEKIAVRAYADSGGGQYMGALMRYKHEGHWDGMMALAFEMLGQAGVSVDSFVHFACEKAQASRGSFPYPEQVFGLRALRAYLAEYRREGVEATGAPTYRASAERKKLHKERMLALGLPPLPVH